MTKLLTVAEAAERLGVTPRRVLNIIKYGTRLPASRFGPVWLIEESNLNKFMRLDRTVGRPRKPESELKPQSLLARKARDKAK